MALFLEDQDEANSCLKFSKRTPSIKIKMVYIKRTTKDAKLAESIEEIRALRVKRKPPLPKVDDKPW